MNDTNILNAILRSMMLYADDNTPASPALLRREVEWAQQQRYKEERRAVPPSTTILHDEYQARYTVKVTPIGAGTVNAGASFQEFWRCKHYPSSIDNFFNRELVCEHGCHKSELRWFDNGCKPATS